jgi:DNA repair exonuclease SbcCD ATPase subunit
MRADRKRDLKAMGDAAEPDIPPDCPALDDVTEQIRELEKSVAELESARTTQLLRVERENSKLRSEYTEKKSRREAAERTVAEMDSWLIERAEEIDSLQRTLKKRGEAQKLDTLIADIKGRQQALRAERARLSAPLQTECPTCHRAYTDIPDHRARLAEIDNEMQVHSDILQKHQDAKNKLPDFDLIDDRLRKHQTAMPKVAAAQVVIDTMGELTEPAYEEADVSELDADIADLKGRIARGREIERTVVRYEEQRKQFQQAAERRAELERTIAKLEKLVEYFSDKGPIKAHLVGGKLPAFVERINEVLERFDFRCDFSLEPFSLIVGRGLDGNSGAKIGLRLNQLSESEEFRFGIAFQVALAEATGIGVVIIDRADMLLPEVRSTLTAAVMDSNLDQVFLLAAGEPMDEFPDVPETTFFELENADGYTVVTSHKSEVGDMTYAAE